MKYLTVYFENEDFCALKREPKQFTSFCYLHRRGSSDPCAKLTDPSS